MEKTDNSFSRRKFLGNAALGTIAAVGATQLLSSCSSGGTAYKREIELLPLLDQAPDGEPIRAGVIGCGGRGTGAAKNFLNAGPNIELVALGDVFQDRIDRCRAEIKKVKGVEVADDMCFVGFDAFKKVLEQDINYVILATPPYFRPEHFQAAVEARKHVFMEKPVAVDPVGVRSVMASAKQAEAAGLCVITGTQRHHKRDYVEIFKRVAGEGAIGKIVGANAYWNQYKLWHTPREDGWSDMEWMIRDWVNWTWLSGDHIVEQHVHNLDVINWFIGKFPVSAVGFGSRQRRPSGDQYDNFSVDFIYDEVEHMHSMCRQINACTRNVSEYIRGTQGYTNCENTIWNTDGTIQFEYDYGLDESGEPMDGVKVSPYDQEHIDLITAIRNGEYVNEAEFTAKSCLTAIMGRISAYTGVEVTWDEMMSSDLKIGPETLAMGPVDIEAIIPIPGEAPKED
jgi:myo-inositol 2-dehydrogenase/D-chiro-inositol 1-dehydrogenase